MKINDSETDWLDPADPRSRYQPSSSDHRGLQNAHNEPAPSERASSDLVLPLPRPQLLARGDLDVLDDHQNAMRLGGSPPFLPSRPLAAPGYPRHNSRTHFVDSRFDSPPPGAAPYEPDDLHLWPHNVPQFHSVGPSSSYLSRIEEGHGAESIEHSRGLSRAIFPVEPAPLLHSNSAMSLPSLLEPDYGATMYQFPSNPNYHHQRPDSGTCSIIPSADASRHTSRASSSLSHHPMTSNSMSVDHVLAQVPSYFHPSHHLAVNSLHRQVPESATISHTDRVAEVMPSHPDPVINTGNDPEGSHSIANHLPSSESLETVSTRTLSISTSSPREPTLVAEDVPIVQHPCEPLPEEPAQAPAAPRDAEHLFDDDNDVHHPSEPSEPSELIPSESHMAVDTETYLDGNTEVAEDAEDVEDVEEVDELDHSELNAEPPEEQETIESKKRRLTEAGRRALHLELDAVDRLLVDVSKNTGYSIDQVIDVWSSRGGGRHYGNINYWNLYLRSWFNDHFREEYLRLHPDVPPGT